MEPNVREQGRALVSDAKQTGKDLAGRAGARAKSGIEDTRQRTARELKTVASALRGSGRERMGEDSMLAPYVEKVADQMDRAGGFLETHTVDDLARDVQNFARRNPALFLGGCFALGVLAARFLKASRPSMPASDGNAGLYGGAANTYRTETH
jgi:hypothetical protein